MAPKQKGVKLTLDEFMSNDAYGSTPGAWADDDLPTSFNNPLPPSNPSTSGGWSTRDPVSDFSRVDRFPAREPVPVPDEPPFTARLNNLDYDASEEGIRELFVDGYQVTSVRVPRDNATGRLRGYAFVEFEDRDSLVKSLNLDGTSLMNRTLRVGVAERREDDRFGGDWRSGQTGPLRGGRERDDDDRDYNNWERTGPLPPFEGRRASGPRRPREDVDDGRDYDNWERKPLPALDNVHPRYRRDNQGAAPPPADDRDYDNWQRSGPLPPRSSGPRKPRADDDRDYDNWERSGPLSSAGGERRVSAHRRREREPQTEADTVDDWRSAPRAAPSGRKKLDLKPRTVSSGSTQSTGSSAVFGAAKPVDTVKRNDKAEQLRKRFEVLSTDDGDDEETADADAPVASKQVPVDEPTSAEKILTAEAPKEELGSDDWNVVKRSGRK